MEIQAGHVIGKSPHRLRLVIKGAVIAFKCDYASIIGWLCKSMQNAALEKHPDTLFD